MFINKNLIASIILGLFSIISYLNFIFLIDSVKANGYIINISGMQRMLSQKIALNSFFLRDNKINQNKLKILIDEMYQNQLKIDEFKSKKELNYLFKNDSELRKQVFNYLDNAKKFLETRDINSFKYIQENFNTLLLYLNQVVNVFEEYNLSQISKINQFTLFILIISIGLILFIYFFILKPTTLNLEIKNEKLKKYIEIVDKNVITSTTDLKGIITYVSEAFCKISGYSKEELIGKPHNIVRDPNMSKEIYEELWGTLKVDKEWEGEIKNIKKDGTFYWVKAKIAPLYDKNIKVGYIAIREDITDKKRIEEMSITDELTKLYNRRYFNDIFTKEIKRNKRDNKYFSFLIMDIDHFKQYNDTYGHQAGDEVLISFAKALKASLHRASDFAFRLGGEEFGIIFLNLNEKDSLEFANIVRKNIEKLKIEHSKNSASPFVTASMGLVVQRGEAILSENEIYKLADEALYEAKESGRNRVILNSEGSI